MFESDDIPPSEDTDLNELRISPTSTEESPSEAISTE